MSGTESPSSAPSDAGSAPGATPPVAAAVASATESAAPAAFSAPEPAVVEAPAPAEPVASEPAVVEAVAAETPAAEDPTSILSEATDAKPEEVKPPEEPAKEGVKAEEPAKDPEPLPTPEYEPFTVPETIKLEDEAVSAFTGILGEFENRIVTNPAEAHAATQELGQKIIDLYTKEVADTTARMAQMQKDVWDRTRQDWISSFRSDPEIGGNRQQTTIQRAGALMDLYGQQMGPERLDSVRKIFAMTGAGDHPEVLRFVNWAASRLTETSRPVVPFVPRAPTMTTRSQRLYKNSPGAA